MALSGNLWPIHLKPKEDELLSSWLVRLARAMNLRLHTFCDLAWPKKQIWNRDIDKSATDDILELLARKTATDLDRVRQTTLSAYEGWLYEKHNPHGNTKWIMPVGVYHRTRRRFGQQFCPLCLAEDKEPYFRRHWRLAFVTLCERHGRLLLDRCPYCGGAVNFHRAALDRETIALCTQCGSNLRSAASFQGEPAAESIISYQSELLEGARRGWVRIPGNGPVYSHLLFDALHQIMRICSTGRRSVALREHVGAAIGLESFDPGFAKNTRDIERLGVEDRMRLLHLSSWLLADWPDRFIDTCRSVGALSSVLLRDMKNAPYWYWDPIHRHLYEPGYSEGRVEIASWRSFLHDHERESAFPDVDRLIGT